ncbi:MAG: MaoC family dehydratase [Acidimicrobiales bacterium]
MTTVINDLDGFRAKLGEHLGYSDWHDVTQDQVNLFADATADHQWIHTDPVRAKAGPFGGPIAHGYLTLSLVAGYFPEVIQVHGISMGVNYGCNKVRFPAPVPVGSQIRVGGTLASIEDIAGGLQACIDVTVEVKGQEKPSCAAQVVFRYYT